MFIEVRTTRDFWRWAGVRHAAGSEASAQVGCVVNATRGCVGRFKKSSEGLRWQQKQCQNLYSSCLGESENVLDDLLAGDYANAEKDRGYQQQTLNYARSIGWDWASRVTPPESPAPVLQVPSAGAAPDGAF